MLHVSDIEKRLALCPEPPEVKEMRESITDAFKDLEFIEVPHKYFLYKEDGSKIELPSVSSVIHRFEPEVNWDAIRIRKAQKEGINPEVLKRQWRENNLQSTGNGTIVHEFGESSMYFFQGRFDEMLEYTKRRQFEDGYLVPYGPKQVAISKFFEDMLHNYNVWPVMPEAKVHSCYNGTLNLKDDYCGTFDMLFAARGKDGVIRPFLADWKGLPLDTPILTKEGFKAMNDIQIGDVIYDKNGNETKVLHTSSIHTNPCYKIRFDNGDEIVCDKDHKWEISFYHNKKVKSSKTMTALEIYEYIRSLSNKKKWSYKEPMIMTHSGLNCPEKELPIDPYVLGVWLGGGSNVSEVVLSEQLKLAGFLKEKCIPSDYFTSSHRQRMSLLKGIMDACGHYIKTHKRYVITTSDKILADDFEALISTFGVKVTVIKTKKLHKITYDVCFWLDEYPFEGRKVEIHPPLSNKHTFRLIKSIEPVETVKTKCIEVDSETHTYLATKKLIVTHNTNKELVNDYNRTYKKVMLPPFDNLIDEALSHYTLQLSAYSLCLEQLGYKMTHRVLVWLREDGTYEKIPLEDLTQKLRVIL